MRAVSVRWPKPAAATYADIRPTSSISSMVLGHFIPLEAATTPEKKYSAERSQVASAEKGLSPPPDRNDSGN
jgi:hypothetical protein